MDSSCTSFGLFPSEAATSANHQSPSNPLILCVVFNHTSQLCVLFDRVRSHTSNVSISPRQYLAELLHIKTTRTFCHILEIIQWLRVWMHANILSITELSDYSNCHIDGIIPYPAIHKCPLANNEKFNEKPTGFFHPIFRLCATGFCSCFVFSFNRHQKKKNFIEAAIKHCKNSQLLLPVNRWTTKINEKDKKNKKQEHWLRVHFLCGCKNKD